MTGKILVDRNGEYVRPGTTLKKYNTNVGEKTTDEQQVFFLQSTTLVIFALYEQLCDMRTRPKATTVLTTSTIQLLGKP